MIDGNKKNLSVRHELSKDHIQNGDHRLDSPDGADKEIGTL